MRTSTPPQSAIACSTIASGTLTSPMSASIHLHSPERPRSVFSASAVGLRMSAFTTFAPSLARRCAHARPMPDDPAVIKTTLFVNLINLLSQDHVRFQAVLQMLSGPRLVPCLHEDL